MTALQNLGLSIGSELILLPRFGLKMFLKAIDAHKPTLMVAVPTLLNAVLNTQTLSMRSVLVTGVYFGWSALAGRGQAAF